MEGFPPNFRPKLLSKEETEARHAMKAQAGNPAPDNSAILNVGQVNLQQQTQAQGLMTAAAPVPPTPPPSVEDVTLSTGDPANIQPISNQDYTNQQQFVNSFSQQQANASININTAAQVATNAVAGAVVEGVATVKEELDNTADLVNNLIIGG